MASLELRMIVLVAYSKKPMNENTTASADGHPQAGARSDAGPIEAAEQAISSANGT